MTTPTGLTRRGIVVEATTRDPRGAALGRARWLLLAVLLPLPGLHARGRSTVVLPDHGIVVKRTKVVFAEIKVGDAVTVTYDLRLVPATAQ